MSREKQDEWKRTQLRIPNSQYELVNDYAESKDLSLNSAILDLINIGLDIVDRGQPPSNIKIYHLSNGIKRVVYGKLVNSFDLDYKNPNLSELREDIEYCLEIMKNSPKLMDRFKFFNKNVFPYQGNNHIDIVDDGVGSLNWLIIEDHLTDKYMKNLHPDFEPNNKDL